MLNKEEFIENFAHKRGIPCTKATEEVNAFLDTILDACENNGGVMFKKMFTLKTVRRKGRKGILNGVSYETPDSKSVKFTIGSYFKSVLNKQDLSIFNAYIIIYSVRIIYQKGAIE